MIYNYHLKSAKILADKLNALATDQSKNLPLNSNIYIVALKDDHIIETLSSLPIKDKLIAHTSGTFNSLKLNSITNRYACFYPMQTLKKDLEINFSNNSIFIEGNNENDLNILKEICLNLSCIPYEINFKQRQKLHIAAIATNNFTYHLFSCIQEYCKKHGLPYSSLIPLFKQTINNIEKELPFELQTGPAKRNEIDTIEKHRELLKNEKYLADIYLLFTNQIKNKHLKNEL